MVQQQAVLEGDRVGLDYDAVIVGAGVAGIYQIKQLIDLGMRATVLEAGSDLGGTWYWNRYPGCRFDSESYTYGYSWSRELLDEWHWKERFSSQPENQRYLAFVAEKFDLRRHMQFDAKVASAHFDDDASSWTLTLEDGRVLTTRFLVTALGLLSAATPPRYPGAEDFKGQSWHTYYWPHEPVELAAKRVGVIGTGATAIQLIAEIADKVDTLTVFQRRPNWAAPLHNGPISEQEMADIRARYDEIFAACASTPGGFEHAPDRRGFHNFTPEERRAFWEELYAQPGFGIWMANFRETFMDEEANAELSAFIADKIRERVHDPVIAEKLIPKDHGFGVQRVPLETNYFEVYNRDNVRLVDLSEAPIERLVEAGVRVRSEETGQSEDVELDILVYATGFDAMTGAFDRIDIRGSGGAALREKWADGPITFLGMQVHGFPNMIMLAGPQSGSASANFPRGIEAGVDWATALLAHMQENGLTRFEATEEAEQAWTEHVRDMYSMVLMRKAKSWFTGYNSNVEGHEYGRTRYFVYNGGAPRYVRRLHEVADNGWEGIDLA
jgi:cation diffusion facilitator CzcD-associated flavoprotein CzcO